MADDRKQEKVERRIFLALGVIACVVIVVLVFLAFSAFHAASMPSTTRDKPAGRELSR